jgi:hypothetical protein
MQPSRAVFSKNFFASGIPQTEQHLRTIRNSRNNPNVLALTSLIPTGLGGYNLFSGSSFREDAAVLS